jgi:hypothetical protein
MIWAASSSTPVTVALMVRAMVLILEEGRK